MSQSKVAVKPFLLYPLRNCEPAALSIIWKIASRPCSRTLAFSDSDLFVPSVMALMGLMLLPAILSLK